MASEHIEMNAVLAASLTHTEPLPLPRNAIYTHQ